jgi:hypothetical protein
MSSSDGREREFGLATARTAEMREQDHTKFARHERADCRQYSASAGFKSARTNAVFPLTSMSVIDRILGMRTADASITALLAMRPKPLIANLTIIDVA